VRFETRQVSSTLKKPLKTGVVCSCKLSSRIGSRYSLDDFLFGGMARSLESTPLPLIREEYEIVGLNVSKSL
jgi:hypothetical protein